MTSNTIVNIQIMAERFPETEIIEKKGQVDGAINQSSNDPVLVLKNRIFLCEYGKKPGQLTYPAGVAYCEATRLMYIADGFRSERICVFSEDGEYINSFGKGKLRQPMGVAVLGENIYVCDLHHHAMYRFILPKYKLVSKVGKPGSSENKFDTPLRICVSTDGYVFIADRGNDRVVVRDHTLKFKQLILHPTMTKPYDVKLHNEEVYVLSTEDNPCMHVFSRSGIKLRSLITQGRAGGQVYSAICFCFDNQGNILIGEYWPQSIRVFSPSGTLLTTLGGANGEDGKIIPQGIIVTPTNKVVCTSTDTKFKLHIFF